MDLAEQIGDELRERLRDRNAHGFTIFTTKDLIVAIHDDQEARLQLCSENPCSCAAQDDNSHNGEIWTLRLSSKQTLARGRTSATFHFSIFTIDLDKVLSKTADWLLVGDARPTNFLWPLAKGH